MLFRSSRFAYTEGGIPIVKTEAYPAVYNDFSTAELVVDNPPFPGEESLFNDMNSRSEIGINQENSHVQRVLEAGLTSRFNMQSIVEDWNARWAKAQKELNVEIY